MEEQALNQLMVVIGVIVAFVYGPTAAFAVRRTDNSTPAEASFLGGLAGAFCGMVWPFTIAATIIGLFCFGLIKAAQRVAGHED